MFKKLLLFCLITTGLGACEGVNNFREKCLKLHNYYRKLHGVKGLEVDENLQKEAKVCAAALQINYDAYAQNNVGVNFGSSAKSARDVIDQWYSERTKYKSYPSNETIHFTQLVWRDSTHLGCDGALDMENRSYFVVAFYKPAGNKENEYLENVQHLPIVQDNEASHAVAICSPMHIIMIGLVTLVFFQGGNWK